MHELGAARKRMPMVRVEHDYRFEGPDGMQSLPELFDGVPKSYRLDLVSSTASSNGIVELQYRRHR